MDESQGRTISIRVQPGASVSRVGDYRDGTLRVSVTAPPHDGRANAAMVELLAESLGVAKSKLRIVRGHRSRHKVVHVDDPESAELLRRLRSSPRNGGT